MSDRARGCFKFACFGCLAVAGLGVVAVIAVVVLVAVTGDRERRIEPVDSVHRLAAVEMRAPLEEGDPRLTEPGRIVLDVSLCSFEIEPGPPGEPVRLEGNYDAAGMQISEDWEQYGQVGWTYRLSLSRRGLPFLFNPDEDDCKVRLVVPREAPFTLEGKIGIGQSMLDLGELDVLAVDLATGAGEHEISFSRPCPRPLDHLRVKGSMGELRVLGIGEASPAEVDVSHSMGEAHVDLGGEWRNDASIAVHCGMGTCQLEVPGGVGVELVRAAMTFGESNFDVLQEHEPRPGLPLLKLSLSGRMGEFRIVD